MFSIWDGGKRPRYAVFVSESLRGGRSGKGVGIPSPLAVRNAKLKGRIGRRPHLRIKFDRFFFLNLTSVRTSA